MSGIPTKASEMREEIILTLAKLHFEDPEGNEGGYLTSDIQFHIWNRLVGEEGWWGDGDIFNDRTSAGKAYERAMNALLTEGVVVNHPNDPNHIEKVLAIFLDRRHA